MEAAAEVAKISKRVMKETTEEAKVKAAAVKAADSVSSVGTAPAATAASTSASVFERDPTSTNSVIGVARRNWCKLIIIIVL